MAAEWASPGLELLFDMLKTVGQEALDVGVVQAVVGGLAVPSVTNQPQLAKGPEGVGDRRLAHPDRGGDIADAELLEGQGVDDPEPAGIAEGPERLGEQKDGGGRLELPPDPSDPAEVGDLDLAAVVRIPAEGTGGREGHGL
jgi:hypothetical protein